MAELNSAIMRSNSSGVVILPVLIGDESFRAKVEEKVPLIADVRSILLNGDEAELVRQIAHAIRRQSRPMAAVCMISSEYPPRIVGGLGIHVKAVSDALVGFARVNIVLPRDEDETGGPYTLPDNQHVRLQVLPQAARYERPTTWVEFARAVSRRIDDLAEAGEKFDVIHCHDWVTVLAGIRCKMRQKIPLLFHIHLPNRTPLCASIENLGLVCADAITVNSHSIRQELDERAASMSLRLPRVHVIKNGVDERVFRQSDEWPADDGYVLFVGRLVEQKGIEYLLRAMPYVLQRFPAVKLKIVGSGHLKDNLERLSSNLLLENGSIEFLGSIGLERRDELASLYKSAALVVVPSVYEPFGMTAIEAMACARPVVASRIGGLKEILSGNEAGYLAEARNELDLAQWIMKLLSDDPLREVMGRSGRRLVESHFTWSSVAEELSGIYGRLPSEAARPESGHVRTFINQIRDVTLSVQRNFPPGLLDEVFDWSRGF